ncbi:MAG TPA: GNAT family acetyltransferase [Caproiciproducens sp.]|nr:GNAT family acetyltransferase [Caproiciproducens sp.]
MSRIVKAVPKDDYRMEISFSDGSTLEFSMKRQIETAQFRSIREREMFQRVCFDDKSIFWQAGSSKPLRLTLDSILFTLRDAP